MPQQQLFLRWKNMHCDGDPHAGSTTGPAFRCFARGGGTCRCHMLCFFVVMASKSAEDLQMFKRMRRHSMTSSYGIGAAGWRSTPYAGLPQAASSVIKGTGHPVKFPQAIDNDRLEFSEYKMMILSVLDKGSVVSEGPQKTYSSLVACYIQASSWLTSSPVSVRGL